MACGQEMPGGNLQDCLKFPLQVPPVTTVPQEASQKFDSVSSQPVVSLVWTAGEHLGHPRKWWECTLHMHLSTVLTANCSCIFNFHYVISKKNSIDFSTLYVWGFGSFRKVWDFCIQEWSSQGGHRGHNGVAASHGSMQVLLLISFYSLLTHLLQPLLVSSVAPLCLCLCLGETPGLILSHILLSNPYW